MPAEERCPYAANLGPRQLRDRDFSTAVLRYADGSHRADHRLAWSTTARSSRSSCRARAPHRHPLACKASTPDRERLPRGGCPGEARRNCWKDHQRHAPAARHRAMTGQIDECSNGHRRTAEPLLVDGATGPTHARTDHGIYRLRGDLGETGLIPADASDPTPFPRKTGMMSSGYARHFHEKIASAENFSDNDITLGPGCRPEGWAGGEGLGRRKDTVSGKADGMHDAPAGKANAVRRNGEYRLSGRRHDHGHIYGMCNGLIERRAASCVAVRLRPRRRIAVVLRHLSRRARARAEAEILEDPSG